MYILPYGYVFCISCLSGYVLENWTILQRQRDWWLQRNLLLYYILHSSRHNQSTGLQIMSNIGTGNIYFWSLNSNRVASAKFFTRMEVCPGTQLSIRQGVRKCRQNNKRLQEEGIQKLVIGNLIRIDCLQQCSLLDSFNCTPCSIHQSNQILEF